MAGRGLSVATKMWVSLVRSCLPSLVETTNVHKGQAGRIAIIGGSIEYTGAPYFAAISALKVGADLAHVFCTKQAAPVIKSYSPELIVHPVLNTENNLNDITTWLERIHVVVIGPGLGRDSSILNIVADIIKYCKEKRKPLVIDADGLFLITERIGLINDYPLPGVILTPNKVEFDRLYNVIKMSESDNEVDEPKIDYNKLGKNVLILRKGSTDQTFCSEVNSRWSNSEGGSPRRCGGQGDLLSGSTATLFHWALNNLYDKGSMMPAAVATYGAAILTRKCNEKGFLEKGRSMICSDMIEKIHYVFEELFERPE